MTNFEKTKIRNQFRNYELLITNFRIKIFILDLSKYEEKGESTR